MFFFGIPFYLIILFYCDFETFMLAFWIPLLIAGLIDALPETKLYGLIGQWLGGNKVS